MINETLHTFISVTKNGSFNKAAEKLSLTAPAVMKQMNSLEKSVGAPLFCRHAAHRRRTLPILPAPSPLTGKKGTGVNRRDATRTLRKPRGNPQKKFMKFSKRS